MIKMAWNMQVVMKKQHKKNKEICVAIHTWFNKQIVLF